MDSLVMGINETNVTSWMVDHVNARAPLTFELIAGGRSNLTYRVVDADGRTFALRRPPTSHVLPTAHDMVREHTVISALYPLGIPVAQPLGLCNDVSVNDRPFYVMEFVDGAVAKYRAVSLVTIWRPPWRDCTTSTSTRLVSVTSRDTTVTLSANYGAGARSTNRCASTGLITVD
jgi:aminoglycoside phosphotransferase (APT) family kinase protein